MVLPVPQAGFRGLRSCAGRDALRVDIPGQTWACMHTYIHIFVHPYADEKKQRQTSIVTGRDCERLNQGLMVTTRDTTMRSLLSAPFQFCFYRFFRPPDASIQFSSDSQPRKRKRKRKKVFACHRHVTVILLPAGEIVSPPPA
jgi:hypothetical protein